MKSLLLIFTVFLSFSCEGQIWFGQDENTPDSVLPKAKEDGKKEPLSPEEESAFEQSPSLATPRLSQREFENIVREIFGIDGLATSRLPPDVAEPFDTDQETKEATNIFVEGIESMAFEVAKLSAQNTTWVEQMAGCTPSAPDDETCLESLADNLGYLLWRTRMEASEITALIEPSMALAKDAGDVQYAIRFIIQGLLQSPRFIYRVEIGEETSDGLIRLTNEELITKLTFVIWGKSPDADLLSKAQSGAFSNEDLENLAEEMMEDPRAMIQIKTFHEMWFEYKHLNAPVELEGPFKAETEALLDRVLTSETLPWGTLFLSDETFVDSTLSAHYGMAEVESPSWVKYENSDRAGLLSHGSILSLSARDVNDTSVTGRGEEIATVFLCRTINPPPPGLVTEKPVATEDSCKSDAYLNISKAGGTCAGCHVQMDPIGFGMERFDGLGKYREIEYGNENCDIEGNGSVVGLGPFSGPKELSEMMLESGELTQCAVQKLLTFSRGHYSQGTEGDSALANRLHEKFLENDQNFKALVLGLVTDPTFRFRREAK